MRRLRVGRFRPVIPLVPSTLLTGIVSSWSLGEAAGASRLDSSGNSYTLTDVNTVDQGTGIVGNCCDFNGTDDRLTRATQTWGFSTAWSISSWHKQDAAANSKTVYQFGASMTVATDSAIRLASNLIYVLGAGAEDKLYTGIPTSTDWTHMVITFDGTTLSVWQNGSDITGAVTKVIDETLTMSDTSRILTIGAKEEDGAVYSEYFTGLIDAIGVWSRVITSTEIAALYNSGNGKEYDFS